MPAERLPERSSLHLDRYSVLGDDWIVSEGTFTAPIAELRREQLLIFAERVRNGSISADITVLDTPGIDDADAANEAALVVRYVGPNSYFFAGLGGFGNKFFIGNASQGPSWAPRTYVGQKKSVVRNRKYRMRVEFLGSQIILYENDVQQLVTADETYQFGQFGLRSWQTRAKFENVVVLKARPRAFLIMPFKAEFDFVYKVTAVQISG
jgi:hypothetical protein